MRFRAQRQSSNNMPEVNLVPMMDVIMSILVFFIILSMTMGNFKSVDVQLPGKSDGKGVTESNPGERLIVGLNVKGQVLLNDRVISAEQIGPQVKAYLNQNPKGIVILNADKAVPYEQVIQLLGTLRDVGGDRVSLAIR
jgi:biopolymer transport protein ExbD